MKRTLTNLSRLWGLHTAGRAILAALTVLLLLAGVALAANGYEITRYVIGGGGGHSEAGGYVLDATVGQGVAGVVNDAPYELCAGFWCGMAEYRFRFPLVLRSYP